MTLLPPPPPSSERPRESSTEDPGRGLPEGYHAQFEKVLQILKDRPDRYDKRRGNSKRPNTTPPDEISTGHSHLTTQGMRQDIYKNSLDAVEDELDAMKTRNPYAWSVINYYFDVDSGHSDYDLLAAQAEESERQRITFDTLQMAMYILVSRLMDKDLHVRKPAKVDPLKTNRTIKMEEDHAEMLRVYDAWIKEFEAQYPGHKKNHANALDNTAIQCNCSVRTIQRVLKERNKENEAA